MTVWSIDPSVGGYVLDQRPAERHIHDLEASADREYREVARQRLAGERNLELISGRVRAIHGRMWFLAVALRFDVAATGKEQPVETVGDGWNVLVGDGSEDDREPTGAFHRIGVGVADHV